MAYVWVFVLIALDAVIVIFPGETTLNAAATLAAQGKLELWPIIVMGSLGAIVGDSTSSGWRGSSPTGSSPRSAGPGRNARVRQALDMMGSSAPVLIVGGRYVPGMRFVVNATMGMSPIPYRRFLLWSVISGILWGVYTTVLAYEVGLALADFPLASFVISGLVTTVAIAVVFLSVRRNRRTVAATAVQDASPTPETRGSRRDRIDPSVWTCHQPDHEPGPAGPGAQPAGAPRRRARTPRWRRCRPR